MIKRYVEFVVRHPLLVVLAVVGVTFLFASQFWYLETVLDPKRILPQGHPYVQLNNEIEKRFGGSRVVVIGVAVKQGDIFNSKTLEKIKKITEEVKGVPGILEGNVVSIADRKIKAIKASAGGLEIKRLMEQVPVTEEEMKELRSNIFDNDLYVGSLVSRDGRAAAIITDFRGGAAFEFGQEGFGGGGQGAGGFTGDTRKGSSGFSPQGTEQKREKETSGQGIPADDKKAGEADWKKWSKNSKQGGSGTDEPPWKKWAKGGDSWYVSDSTIYERLLAIAQRERDPETEIYIGGLPVALAFLEADTDLMNRVVFPLAFAVIMGVLYLSFQSFQGMIIPILTALLSVVWAIGLTGTFRIPLDPWTQTLTPILIVAIAAGHSLQILKRYYEELARLGATALHGASHRLIHRSAVVESTSKMIPVMATAGLVAAISFASLITFQLKTFQSFGLLTAFGILSAIVLEMTFIPACRTLLPPPRIGSLSTGRGFLDRPLASLGGWLARGSAGSAPGEGSPTRRTGAMTVVWISAAVALFALVAAFQVKVNNSLKSQFFKGTPLRLDDAALNQFFGGTSTFYVLIQSSRPGDLKEPQVMRNIEGLQQLIAGVPGVGKTQSYVDYIKKMNRSLHGGDVQYEVIPESRSAVAEYLFLYSISGNPADFDRLVDYDYQRAVLWAFLKSDSTLLAQELIRQVNQYAAEHFQGYRIVGPQGDRHSLQAGTLIQDVSSCGVTQSCLGVAGSAPVTVALNETMVNGKVKNMIQIGLIAFLVSTLVLRSLVGGLLVLLPLALAVLINFGVMGLTGITLGIGTAAISAMAVGMGADYAIYLLFRIREEWKREGNMEKAVVSTLTTAGKAVIAVAFAISAGCFTLVFPGYYLHMEGILVPLAMLTSSAGALTLLPALVLLLKPRFLERE